MEIISGLPIHEVFLSVSKLAETACDAQHKPAVLLSLVVGFKLSQRVACRLYFDKRLVTSWNYFPCCLLSQIIPTSLSGDCSKRIQYLNKQLRAAYPMLMDDNQSKVGHSIIHFPITTKTTCLPIKKINIVFDVLFFVRLSLSDRS